MEKIRKAFLWHVTPIDIGIDFYNPTISTLTIDSETYTLVSPYSKNKMPHYYSHSDIIILNKLQRFNSDFVALAKKNKIDATNAISYIKDYPEIKDCFCCFKINENLFLHFLTNGTAVFFESGDEIEIIDERFFSYDLYKERKIYEDDYCCNKENSKRKELIYKLIDLIWETAGKNRRYTATNEFCIHGVPYTLCIEMIDIANFDLSRATDQLKKNLLSLNDTAPFSNVLSSHEENAIKKCIDNYDISPFKCISASDSLLFMDSWAGVVLAGDIEQNINTALSWILKFEVHLQSKWCFFNFLLEDSIRTNLSHLQLKEKIDVAKYEKIELENDISSTMEQTKKNIRSSLIQSSEINVIYGKMIGVLENRYNLKSIQNENKKTRYSMFTDFMLLLIALFQIYTVIEAFVYEGFNIKDLIPIGVVSLLSIVGLIFIIKSKKD